ncbi:MAG TPA: hypothetical protein VN637_06890, partial [Roseiarcus sp.]|nr:hypothetical protein [Roseiarcus sp.]
VLSDFNGLRRHFGPSATAKRHANLRGGVADAAGCFASRSVRLKRGQNETLISRSETKRFATHAVSHWNPYERRIRHFAGSFVFKSLAPFSFRRFHGAPVFNGLAPLFVSPFADPLPAG